MNSKYIVDAFLTKKFPNKVQIFDTKNVVGDSMQRIYDDGTVQIDYCKQWGYIEIFGLPKKDYEEIYMLHDGAPFPEEEKTLSDLLKNMFEIIELNQKLKQKGER